MLLAHISYVCQDLQSLSCRVSSHVQYPACIFAKSSSSLGEGICIWLYWISQGSCSSFIHLSASSKLDHLSQLDWESTMDSKGTSPKSLIKRLTNSYPKIRPLWYSTYQPEGWLTMDIYFLSIHLSIHTDYDISVWIQEFCGRPCQKIAKYTISIVLSSCTNPVSQPSDLMTLVRHDEPFVKLCCLFPNTVFSFMCPEMCSKRTCSIIRWVCLAFRLFYFWPF